MAREEKKVSGDGVKTGRRLPAAKPKRGVVIFNLGGLVKKASRKRDEGGTFVRTIKRGGGDPKRESKGNWVNDRILQGRGEKL